LISAGAADPAAMGKLTTLIGVPRLLQWRRFTWWERSGQGCGDRSWSKMWN